MTFLSPAYAKRKSVAAAPTKVVPETIELTEPVVAAGEVVYAGETPEIDIVMAIYQVVNLEIV